MLLARCEARQGHYDEAISRLRLLLQAAPANVQARLLLGKLLEEQGDPAGALEVYAWVADPQRHFLDLWQAGNPDALGTPQDILAIASCLDREAYLSSRYARDRRLHDLILSMFTRVYDVIDRGNPEAHVLAARFFSAHDDGEQALGELEAALRTNPNQDDAIYEVGLLALETLDFDRADDAVRKLRAINPKSFSADLLEVRSLLAQRQPQQALALSSVMAARPQSRTTEASGLHAAAVALCWRPQEVKSLLRRASEQYHNSAEVDFILGDHYAGMRQYSDAETALKAAVARAPWMTEARNALGLLYTQSGDEKAARTSLEAARQLDPFNLRTTNYLRLLDELESFAREESAHFIVLYDGKSDPFIASEVLAYMEANYPRICGLYQYEPAEKTLIEIFPSHDRFSARITGTRWIATIGASTGRVIALASPRQSDQSMPYEWGEVLRHEFTHTVTLSATGNRISHWLTEGLAVGEEGAGVRAEWAPLLAKAAREGTLFTLDNITWGFARPRKPQDRSLAYAQSFLMCRYLCETYGEGAIGKLLAAVRDNIPEKEAIRSRLGAEPAAFEAAFAAWLTKFTGTWGYDPKATQAYEAAVKTGESLIAEKKYAEAIKNWEEASQIRPMELVPHQLLAGLYLSKPVNTPAAAAAHLEVLNREELKNGRYAKRLAKLYDSMGQSAKAIDACRRATRIDPWDAEAREQLASLLTAAGDAAAASQQKRIIALIRANTPAAASGGR